MGRKKAKTRTSLKKLGRAITRFRRTQRKNNVIEGSITEGNAAEGSNATEGSTVTESKDQNTISDLSTDPDSAKVEYTYCPIIYNNASDLEIKILEAKYTLNSGCVDMCIILQIINHHKWSTIRNIYLSLPIKSKSYDSEPGIMKDKASIMLYNQELPSGTSKMMIKRCYIRDS